MQGYEKTETNQTVVVRNRAYPDWSKIILVGHSTGAASAAFLSMHLPMDPGLKRVVLLSGPNDHVNLGSGPQGDMQPAEWIYSAGFNGGASRTPMNRVWGLRHIGEGDLGDFTKAAWDILGGVTIGIGAVGPQDEFNVDDGSVLPDATNISRHRLLLLKPANGASSFNHNVTAADCYGLRRSVCETAQETIKKSWNYLISGGHSNDQ